MLELVGFIFVMLSLLKFITSTKMFIMMMSLEMSSIFLYFLLSFVSFSGNLVFGYCSFFLVFVVCEGVVVLLGMVNIFRKGSLMVESLYFLKF